MQEGTNPGDKAACFPLVPSNFISTSLLPWSFFTKIVWRDS